MLEHLFSQTEIVLESSFRNVSVSIILHSKDIIGEDGSIKQHNLVLEQAEAKCFNIGEESSLKEVDLHGECKFFWILVKSLQVRIVNCWLYKHSCIEMSSQVFHERCFT